MYGHRRSALRRVSTFIFTTPQSTPRHLLACLFCRRSHPRQRLAARLGLEPRPRPALSGRSFDVAGLCRRRTLPKVARSCSSRGRRSSARGGRGDGVPGWSRASLMSWHSVLADHADLDLETILPDAALEQPRRSTGALASGYGVDPSHMRPGRAHPGPRALGRSEQRAASTRHFVFGAAVGGEGDGPGNSGHRRTL